MLKRLASSTNSLDSSFGISNNGRIDWRYNESVEADELAKVDEAAGRNSYRGSVVAGAGRARSLT
jgi:hypothetical protein